MTVKLWDSSAIKRILSRASRSFRFSIGSHCLSACTLALKLIRRGDTFVCFAALSMSKRMLL